MKKMINSIAIILLLGLCHSVIAQSNSEMSSKEAEYYRITDIRIPEDIVLEVGGLALMDRKKIGVSTRRGEVWIIDSINSNFPIFYRYAHGLHEPLGLAFKDQGFYLAQRGELTRLEDNNGDGKADLYKTIYSWPLSGNYHDYSYGPKIMDNGDMIVTLNLSWIGGMISSVKWRGWMLRITPEGEMTPIATGLRSPAGIGITRDGELFYTENQGGWVGSGRMTHLEVGDFAGHPAGLKWTGESQSPLELTIDQIKDDSGMSLYQLADSLPNVKAPAIWFPHTILGISTSDILIDDNSGKFGPFDGQMFIGDQGQSKIMRVFLEKVNGEYQGAAFSFREGFSSGVLRMIWGADANMIVGMTSRGWGSTGKKDFGLQQLVWTGKTPFEIQTMKALDDGFLLTFTKPVNKKLAIQTSSYKMASFTYHYHSTYGSPIVDQQKGMIHEANVSENGMEVKLKVHGMRLGYIHQIKATGVQSQAGELLLHNEGYYTLNQVPGGVLKSPSIPGTSANGKTIKQPKRINEIPIIWRDKVDERLVIGTKPGLKYDVNEIEVKSRARIEITFNNSDDMLHNLVIVAPGPEAPNKVGEMAAALGLDGPDLNYVPETNLVLSHTGVLQPNTSEKIYFQVPREPGQYWIVCTFPGHYLTMRAKLLVK